MGAQKKELDCDDIQVKLLNYAMMSHEADKLAVSVANLESILSKVSFPRNFVDAGQILSVCDTHPVFKELLSVRLKQMIAKARKRRDVTLIRNNAKYLNSSESSRRQTRRFCKSNGLRVRPQFWYKCVVKKCHFADYTREKMVRHYKEKHSYIVLNKNDLPFDELQLTTMEESRRVGKRSFCYSCSKKFEDESRLSSHVRAVHVPEKYKRYSCFECEERFVLQIDLEAHLKVCT